MLIKICGLTTTEEAEYLNQNQVDFAGMVLFYPKSKRNIDIVRAKTIIERLNGEISPVAVVVSPDMKQVREIEAAGFRYIQIHGEIPEPLLKEEGIPILKAFNIKDMDAFDQYQSEPRIAGFVFDAQEPGSGKVFDWNMISNLPRGDKLFLLAGGLKAENVVDAIRCVKPDGVDVSSGVEYQDRLGKDKAKIDEFVRIVRKNS